MIETINDIMTAAFDACFSIMESWPGWLSLTFWSTLTGIGALVVYKYASNQTAIGQVRDDIKANLLAVKLFKEELSVTLKSQGKLFWAAVRLLGHSLVPFAVMFIPMTFLIVQMSLRYEWRPLLPGETILLRVLLNDQAIATDVDAQLEAPDGIEVETKHAIHDDFDERPKRNEIVWRLKANALGLHKLKISVDGQEASKEISVNQNAYARISPVRPGEKFLEKVIYPAEAPAQSGSTIQRIELDLRNLPKGATPIFGFNIHWIISFFVISIVAALIFKPILKVRL